MAFTILGQSSTNYNGGALKPPASNSKVASAFGLPGKNLPAAYCRCELQVRIAVMSLNNSNSPGRCYVNVGGTIRQNTIYGTNFPSFLCVRQSSFTAQPNNRTGQVKSATITKSANPGTYNWNLGSISAATAPGASVTTNAQLDAFMANQGYVYVGMLQSFGWVSGGNSGYLWIGGTASYPITNPIYPPAVRIEMPNIKQLLEQPYFPGAVLGSGNTWQSCNRSGGSNRIYASGAWRNVQCMENTASSPQQAFRNTSASATIRCAKMGSGSGVVALSASYSDIDFGNDLYPDSTVGPVTVTVTSLTDEPTGAISLAVTGSAAFTLSTSSLASITSANGTRSFTIVPRANLNPGDYEGIIVVTPANDTSSAIYIGVSYQLRREGESLPQLTLLTNDGTSVTFEVLTASTGQDVIYCRSEIGDPEPNGNWQSSPVFLVGDDPEVDIVSGETYNFYACTDANNEYYNGEINEPIEVTVS